MFRSRSCVFALSLFATIMFAQPAFADMAKLWEALSNLEEQLRRGERKNTRAYGQLIHKYQVEIWERMADTPGSPISRLQNHRTFLGQPGEHVLGVGNIERRPFVIYSNNKPTVQYGPGPRVEIWIEKRLSPNFRADRVILAASSNGWSKTEVARRLDMPDSTFSLWFSGQYKGRLDNTNRQVRRWLDGIEEMSGIAAAIPTSPQFLMTNSAREIMDTLAWAQATGDMVMITLNAGMGKTAACRHYRAVRPNVHLVTMSPHTKTVHGMLVELSAELDVMVLNPAKLSRAIGRRLERTGGGTLLIVDEAQNLMDEAINQLHHFVDNYQCGVALVGNSEIYGRFVKRTEGPSYAQLKSRLGKRLKHDKPNADDLKAYISAWGVTDAESVKFLTGIGLKGGALRQIDKTMKLAAMYAAGSASAVTLEHIRGAWKNRDVEELA